MVSLLFQFQLFQLFDGGDLVRVLLLEMEARLPRDGQSDLLALFVGDCDGALAGKLLLLDQLGQREARLDLLFPALGLRHGNQRFATILLDLGGAELERQVDLNKEEIVHIS